MDLSVFNFAGRSAAPPPDLARTAPQPQPAAQIPPLQRPKPVPDPVLASLLTAPKPDAVLAALLIEGK